MKYANYDILSFLQSIYLPNNQTGAMRLLRNHLREGLYGEPYYKTRLIEKTDAGRIRTRALWIKTKGDSKRKSFAGYELVQIDINKVGDKYAEVYIYPMNSDGTDGIAKRICYSMPTLTILII